MQNYSTVTPRIGKLKGQILKHAIPKEVLGMTGTQHKIGKNQSDTVIYRRWLPYGASTAAPTGDNINQWVVDANAHLTQEGVTPAPDTIKAQDITVTLRQYSCLYVYSDKSADLYEDSIPDAMKKQTGQRMGLVREKIRYGALRGCTNKHYPGAVQTRVGVNATISKDLLRRISRNLQSNRSEMVTEVLSSSPNYNTFGIEAGYLVFVHTDMEADIRDIEGFVSTADYGSRKVMAPSELGSADRYRFIVSPELDPYIAAGAAKGATGLICTDDTNVDVYPMIMVAEDAWGDVALRGMESFGVTHIPHGQKEKSDPHGQRGYIGSIFWSASFIQNDGWMAVAEVGATDL